MSGSFSFCPCSSLARHIRAFFSGLYCVVPPSAAFILALWVNGCAAVAQPDRAQVSAESGGNHDTERDSLPPLALTSQIVFRVLAAEIAVQRNLFAPAYHTYLMLARETHDPRMAQPAAQIALCARSPSDALAAARVWWRDAPHSGRAARLALAQIYLANRQLDDALREFQALHIQSPNDPAPLMGLARIHIEQNRPDAAEENLHQYLQAAKPGVDTGQAYLYLALLAAEKNDTAQAMQWLDNIRPTSSRYASGQLARAQLLAQSGKIDDARALLARLQSSDPLPSTQLLIARIDSAVLLAAQRYTEAEARLAQAYKIWPDAPELIYDYAMAAERNQHYARMEMLLSRLIELRPEAPDAYNALGYSLADRGQQLDKAKQLIEKAVQRAPDNPYILDSLGWVQSRMGNIEEAAIALQRAYRIEPHAEIGAHLGEALWMQGQKEEAGRIWRDAQRIEPDNAVLRETMRRFLGQP